MNGVITEDRFKSMTDIQWWIHYKMIEREEAENWRIKKELFRTVMDVSTQNLATIVEDAARFSTMIISPKNYSIYTEEVKKKQISEGKVDNELVEMENLFKDLLESGEIEASISLDIKPEKDTLDLPITSRKRLGIQKNEVK